MYRVFRCTYGALTFGYVELVTSFPAPWPNGLEAEPMRLCRSMEEAMEYAGAIADASADPTFRIGGFVAWTPSLAGPQPTGEVPCR